MDDLIKKLESAECGSRELDGKIYRRVELSKGHLYRETPEGWQTNLHGTALNPVWSDSLASAPHYTTSLDAALTLVPEGWGWQVSDRAPNPHAGRAYLHNRELHFVGVFDRPNPRFECSEETAATPALALCIAALKARQVSDG